MEKGVTRRRMWLGECGHKDNYEGGGGSAWIKIRVGGLIHTM